jgi:tetratricopeptide (TPR) repeat protein
VPHFHGNAQLALFLADHGRALETTLGETEAAWAATPNVGAADALAWCYHRLGRTADASAMMARALRWKTPSPEFEFHAGMIASAAGRTAEARKHLERALALNLAFRPRAAAEAKRFLRLLPVDS